MYVIQFGELNQDAKHYTIAFMSIFILYSLLGQRNQPLLMTVQHFYHMSEFLLMTTHALYSHNVRSQPRARVQTEKCDLKNSASRLHTVTDSFTLRARN